MADWLEAMADHIEPRPKYPAPEWLCVSEMAAAHQRPVTTMRDFLKRNRSRLESIEDWRQNTRGQWCKTTVYRPKR